MRPQSRALIPARRHEVELSRVELATLRVLATRAGAPCMNADDDDRAVVDTSLARLLDAGGDTGNLARAARNSSAPPPPAE